MQLILVWLGLVDHYLRVGLTGLVQLPGGRGGLILVTDVYGGCVPGIHQTCERMTGAKDTSAQWGHRPNFPSAFLVNPLRTWRAKGRVNAFSKPPFKPLFNRGQRMERPVSPWIWGRRVLGACGGEPAEHLLWIQSRDQRHFTQKWGTTAKVLLENPLGLSLTYS